MLPTNSSSTENCCAQTNELSGTTSGKTTLAQLVLGQTALVRDIRAQGELGRRLRDMGLLAGAVVSVASRAPLGDPIAVDMEGCTLSLRCAEAAQVIVEPV